jgi:ABC-2 type transport system ATP-binding protein
VVMINGGKKVLDGSLNQIKTTYGARFVKVGYDGDSGFLSGLKYVKNVKDYGKELEIELEDINDKEKLLKEMVKKLTINSFMVTEPSLNSIFIRKLNHGDRT